MEIQKKKQYQTPALIVHGDVEQITRDCGRGGADSPSGNRGQKCSAPSGI